MSSRFGIDYEKLGEKGADGMFLLDLGFVVLCRGCICIDGL